MRTEKGLAVLVKGMNKGEGGGIKEQGVSGKEGKGRVMKGEGVRVEKWPLGLKKGNN